jgi:hypothetical protein
LAPAYETLGACTKASSPASSGSDRQTWDMARLPQVGNFSPSGLCGVLPCPCFECAHVHKRACTKKRYRKRCCRRRTRPSWAQLVWESDVVRMEESQKTVFC